MPTARTVFLFSPAAHRPRHRRQIHTELAEAERRQAQLTQDLVKLAQRLRQTRILAPGQARLGPGVWNSGADLWLIDLVAPFGGTKDMLADLAQGPLAGRMET